MAEYVVRKPPGFGGDLYLVDDRGTSSSVRHPHHHRELEINLMSRGRGSYIFPDRRIQLLPGALLLLPSGREHLFVPERGVSGEGTALWVAVFDRSIVEMVEMQLQRGLREGAMKEPDRAGQAEKLVRPLDSVEPVMCYPKAARFEQLLKLFELFEQDKGESCTARSGLGYILTLCLETFRVSTDQAHRALSPPIRAFIAQGGSWIRRGEPFELADICREIGISHPHLCRLCAAELGLSPKRYIDLLRYRRFLKLREEEPGMDIETAARRSGFRNYHHLYRVRVREGSRSPGGLAGSRD